MRPAAPPPTETGRRAPSESIQSKHVRWFCLWLVHKGLHFHACCFSFKELRARTLYHSLPKPPASVTRTPRRRLAVVRVPPPIPPGDCWLNGVGCLSYCCSTHFVSTSLLCGVWGWLVGLIGPAGVQPNDTQESNDKGECMDPLAGPLLVEGGKQSAPPSTALA